ncbi:hypothetical protein AB0F25_30365 [Streptomyces wedmorensis]|uniref:hypothetical protein n=1 Tax=Streptomyces wedmorensis TaxID=43759 RepID=UPI00342719BB
MDEHDPSKAVVEVTRLRMRILMRAYNGREGGIHMERRRLLEGALAAAGLYVSQAALAATSAQASSFEMERDASQALARTSRKLQKIAIDHMGGASVTESQQRALACWRDSIAVKVNSKVGPRLHRAANIEARAAGLVAMFFADQGDHRNAQSWYQRADAVTRENNTKGWLLACQAWGYLFNGDGTTAVGLAGDALALYDWANAPQRAFAYNQMARGHAINGDFERALESLAYADEEFQKAPKEARETDPSLIGFSKWQHAAYAADVYSMAGETERARVARAVAMTAPKLNGMNRLIAEVGEAQCLVADGEPEAAVQRVQRTLTGLSTEDQGTAVVVGKARLFVHSIPTAFDSKPVRELKEYLAAA